MSTSFGLDTNCRKNGCQSSSYHCPYEFPSEKKKGDTDPQRKYSLNVHGNGHCWHKGWTVTSWNRGFQLYFQSLAAVGPRGLTGPGHSYQASLTLVLTPANDQAHSCRRQNSSRGNFVLGALHGSGRINLEQFFKSETVWPRPPCSFPSHRWQNCISAKGYFSFLPLILYRHFSSINLLHVRFHLSVYFLEDQG